jgi:prepilin-type N-terminal cleavage/methylation domain-containing protein
MKKILQKMENINGFTLLELIVTITVAAILGTFLIAFMGSAVSKSADPVRQARDLYTTHQNIEQYASLYAAYLNSATPNWTQFKTNLGCASPSNLASCPSSGRCCKVTSGSIYNANFESIQVTYTTGDQKIISYFME